MSKDMSQVTDFSFDDVMRMAVNLFGRDENMESCKDFQELSEWVGNDGMDRIAEELDNE